MKKSLKNLELKKETISNLNLNKIKGGGDFYSLICGNSYVCGNTARTGPGGRPICVLH